GRDVGERDDPALRFRHDLLAHDEHAVAERGALRGGGAVDQLREVVTGSHGGQARDCDQLDAAHACHASSSARACAPSGGWARIARASSERSTSIASEESASSTNATPAPAAASRWRLALSRPKRAGIASGGRRKSAEVPPSRDGASAAPRAGAAASSCAAAAGAAAGTPPRPPSTAPP